MDLHQIGWISLNRFGMGAAPGELASRTDPAGWLRSQLSAPETGETPLSGLPGHAAILREMYALRAEVYGWEDIVRLGSHTEASRAGLMRLEGKTYVVQDGDCLNIRNSA